MGVVKIGDRVVNIEVVEWAYGVCAKNKLCVTALSSFGGYFARTIRHGILGDFGKG
jgi:hypothetical protein